MLTKSAKTERVSNKEVQWEKGQYGRPHGREEKNEWDIS